MKERPIIFTTELIPKILDGTKTQTRRVIKPQPYYEETIYDKGWVWEGLHHQDEADLKQLISFSERCPYGQVGDRLWVRETFAKEVVDAITLDDYYDEESEYYLLPRYKADGYNISQGFDIESGGDAKWESPIHMPRWASRITLEITALRVERLQEISEKDAKAEGTKPTLMENTEWLTTYYSYKWAFPSLWDSLNAKYPWESNPWVWVIEFKKIWILTIFFTSLLLSLETGGFDQPPVTNINSMVEL